MATINVSTWGATGAGQRLPGRIAVMVRTEETKSEAAQRSIARRLRLAVCNCQAQGSEVGRNGKVMSHHYELTLGTPLRSGGYSVEGRVWIAIAAQ